MRSILTSIGAWLCRRFPRWVERRDMPEPERRDEFGMFIP
jgi:hypothetical protein